MATKHLIFTSTATLYGKAVAGSEPWATDVAPIVEDVNFPGIYPASTDAPFVYVQAGADPGASDTLLGDVRQFYYGTVTGGDLMHARRVHAWDWLNASLDDKVKSLYTATELIEKFNFVGQKTDPNQGLEFPRVRETCLIGGTVDVPAGIVQAVYLIADALIGGRDPDADFESQNVKVETFGPVRTEFATDKGPMQHIANLVPSPSAWALILPFLGINTSFSVNKG